MSLLAVDQRNFEEDQPVTTPAPGTAAGAAPIVAAPPGAATPLPVPTTRAKRTGWVAWVITLGVLGVLYLAFIYGIFLGNTPAFFAAVAALVPLGIVIFTVIRVDRWEPEPALLLWFAVLWGAIGSILLTDLYLSTLGTSDEWTAIVIQAPILEEITKGLGVVILFLFARRYFDGPVDGLVYGALIGAGFAFTENIQYLGGALVQGGGFGMLVTFFDRGILSPFLHPIATGITGLAFGFALKRGMARGPAFGFGLLGLLGAIAFHALWNFIAVSVVREAWYVVYLVLMVPLFALFVWGAVYLLRQEQKVTLLRLGEYRDAGWFTAQEVDLLATPKGRRQALAWARQQPGDHRAQMQKFIQTATGLAFARQRAISGRDPLAGAVDEPAFLQATLAARDAYFRAAAGGAR